MPWLSPQTRDLAFTIFPRDQQHDHRVGFGRPQLTLLVLLHPSNGELLHNTINTTPIFNILENKDPAILVQRTIRTGTANKVHNVFYAVIVLHIYT